MRKVTDAQKKVLRFIHERIELDGFPPTYAEIANALKYKSANSASDHVKWLEKKGALKRKEGSFRGITLTEYGLSQLPVKDRIETEALIYDFMSYRTMYTAAREELVSRMPVEITPEQFIALKIASEGPIFASELAKRCDVKGPSLSRMLDTLEGLKAIKRVPDPADTRRTIVRIQAKGVKLLLRAS